MKAALDSRGRKPQLTPVNYLRHGVGYRVIVRTKDGREYVGVLEAVDGAMNMVLSDCSEVNGEAFTKHTLVFIRGSNIVFVGVEY